ncbi:MAG: carbon storage regulator [Pirellulales bacterium]
MLVLSRKESQRIKLGESIVVTVVRVTGDKVRLGIEAPSDVLILREELDPHEATAMADQEEETLVAASVDQPGFTTAQPV